jgi:AcrR family transcriptional regulator
MRQSAKDIGTTDEGLKALLAALVVEKGADPIARSVGVSRGALTAYFAGTARRGTILLIQEMAKLRFKRQTERRPEPEPEPDFTPGPDTEPAFPLRSKVRKLPTRAQALAVRKARRA